MNWEPQPNLTGVFPTGYDYPRTGLSFDPDSAARSASYEEMQRKEREDRERREAEERESRRMTDLAVNVALMGACMGGCG